jgi:hypothetical protein
MTGGHIFLIHVTSFLLLEINDQVRKDALNPSPCFQYHNPFAKLNHLDFEQRMKVGRLTIHEKVRKNTLSD